MVAPVSRSLKALPRPVSEAAPATPGAVRPSPFDKSYWQAIDTLGRRPPAGCAQIRFLREPDAAWDERIQLVRNAKESIYGSLYAICPDAMGFQLLSELIAARKRGVDVCIAVDTGAMLFNGASGSKSDRQRLKGLMDELQRAGGTIAWAGTADDQVRLPGAGVHLKSLIADQRTAIFGGRNIGDEYFGKWSDFDARLQGTVVRTIGRETLELLSSCRPAAGLGLASPERMQRYKGQLAMLRATLEQAAHPPSEPGFDFHMVNWDPLEDGACFGDENAVTQALVETVSRAQREVLITSNSLSPDPALRDALAAAVQRGVRVRLVTAGPGSLGKLVYATGERKLRDLASIGCEVYLTRSHEHGKMYVVDGQVGGFGSYNASRWADQRNAEGLLFTGEQKVVHELKRCVEQTIARCDLYRPHGPNALERFAARLFGAWRR